MTSKNITYTAYVLLKRKSAPIKLYVTRLKQKTPKIFFFISMSRACSYLKMSVLLFYVVYPLPRTILKLYQNGGSAIVWKLTIFKCPAIMLRKTKCKTVHILLNFSLYISRRCIIKVIRLCLLCEKNLNIHPLKPFENGFKVTENGNGL